MVISLIILDFRLMTNQDESSYFVDNEGYNHYIVKLDDANKLIISKKNLTLLDLIAPFSYLFIIFSLFLLLFLLGYMVSGGFQSPGIQFQQSIASFHHCDYYYFFFCSRNDHPLQYYSSLQQ